MKKNVAGQFVGIQLVSKTDGSNITTGTTTVYVTGDAGTQAAGSVGSGACTHEGNGFWTYAPAQAETNYDHVAFTFENTSAVTATVQIYPAFPQTGDNFARLGAPAGASVSADLAAVKAETATILSDTNDIQTRLPAALVSGRIDASAGAIAANAITAASIAADAITAAKVADGTIDAATFAAGAINAAAIAADAITAAKVADGTIDAATFAAGAINAAAIAADAITDAKVASDVTIASVTGAVGSVTGLTASDVAAIKAKTDNLPTDPADQSLVIAATDAIIADTNDIQARLPAALVSGRMDSSVGAMAANVVTAAAIADAAIDNATFATDTGKQTLRSNTAQAGAAGTITLDASASAVNDAYKNALIVITSGTGVGQARTISGYVGATKVASVTPNWTTAPSSDSVFAILPAGAVAGATAPTAAEVADAVWDEAITDHLGAGSTGAALNAAGSAGDPWTTPLPGAYGAGTAGKIVGDNVNATISSRSSQTSVDDLPTNAELATALGTADDATLAQVALVKAKTDLIPASPAAVGSEMILTVAYDAAKTAATQTSVDDLPTNAELATALGTADDAVLAQVALVKAKTDNLPSDPADESLVIAATDAIFARLGAPAGASVSADVAAAKVDTAAIKIQTDKLAFTVANKVDANPTAINGDATAAASLAKTTRAIGRGTVAAAASVTSIPTSAFLPLGAAVDQFKGRIVTFDADTATLALRGQSTDITASTNAAAPTLTVTALSTAPASGDTFSVT